MKSRISAILMAVLLSGCWSMRVSLVDSAETSEKFAVSVVKGGRVDHFNETQSTTFFFWGIVPPPDIDPSTVLSAYLQGGSRISNLRITSEQSFTDGLISSLTLGIVNPWTIRYEGDVVINRGKRPS